MTNAFEVPLLSRAAGRTTAHPSISRLALSPGARPVGLFLDELQKLIVVAEIGTRRLSVLDAASGDLVARAPLTSVVDPDLREQTIGGALLTGGTNAAYFWSADAAGRLRRVIVHETGALEVQGNAFVGDALLRDWLWDPVSGHVLLTFRDDPHLYLADAELRIVTVLPLPAPGGSVGLLPGARALTLLDQPDEGLALVDLARQRIVTVESPWAALSGFPQPPAKPPVLNVAPLAVDAEGGVGYVGSLRTDAANRQSPLVQLDLARLEVRDVLVDDRLATPTRLALHPSGLELYVSGEAATSAVDTRRLEVITDLAPGRLTALSLSNSGRVGVGVNIENTTAFLFDARAGETLTASLRPDTDPTELAGVSVAISETLGAAFVADRFEDAILVLPFQ